MFARRCSGQEFRNQCALLFELDTAIQQLNLSGADEAARRSLIGCYHNLMRKWSDT